MAKKGWRQTRWVAIACATAVCYAPAALALGLGPLTVESDLGQPLQAHVRLLGFQPGDRHEMTAQLASSATFVRLGLRKNHILRSVICRIRRDANGHYVVMLDSRDVVNSPFVQFVLEVKDPNGILLRKYTALLNPANGVQAVSMKSTERTPVPAQQVIAATPMAAPHAPQKVAHPATLPVTQVVHVRQGQTAWVIATHHTPTGALVPQTLEAFLRRNPGAFMHHNINDLRAGATLHVPSAHTVRSIPTAKAGSWLAAQDQAWSQYREKLAGQPAATGSSNGTVGGALRAAQILPASQKLLKIKAAQLPGMTGTAGAAGKGGKAKGLAARMAQLRKELSATKRLMALDNSELALLEREARARAKHHAAENAVSGTVANKAQKPVVAKTVAHTKKPVVAKTAAHTKKPGMKKMVPAHGVTMHHVMHRTIAKHSVRPVRRFPIVQPMRAPTNTSFLATLWKEDRYPLLLAALAVIAVGGLFYYRRKRSMNEFEESILSGGGLQTEGQMPDTASLGKAPEVSFLSEFSQGGTGNMQTDEVDPIAEADVYLAYGRDEQAEEILKEAISRDGGRLELKAKLLEIYLQRNDLKTFEVLAEELYAATSGSGALWQRVEAMGQKIDPMNPLFKSGSASESGSPDGGKNPAAQRIDFAAVARELEAVSTPTAEGGGHAASESLGNEPLEFGDASLDLGAGHDGGSVEFGGAAHDVGTATLDSQTQSFAPDQGASLDFESHTQSASTESDDSALDFSGSLGEPEFPHKLDEGTPSAIGGESAAGAGLPTVDFAPGGDTSSVTADSGAEMDLGSVSVAEESGLDFSWDATVASEADKAPTEDMGEVKFNTAPADEAQAPDLVFGSLEEADGGNFAHEQDEAPILDLSAADAGEEHDLVIETETVVEESGGADAVDTKLDLANAYIEMGDADGARAILDEVMTEGNERQRNAAQSLAARSEAH